MSSLRFRASRRLVAVALWGLAGACAPPAAAPDTPDATTSPSSSPTSASPLPTTPSPSETSPSPSPSLSPSPTEATPSETATAMPWAVPDHEVHLPIKERAVEVVLALTTRDPGDDPEAVARRAVGDDPASVDAVAAAARRLVSEEHASVGRVVYPQMGGLTSDRASVMVVVEVETTAPDGASTTQRRTIDVRLERDGDQWVLDRLESLGGDPVARPDDLPAVAERVLDDPRIVLPDSARWDIHGGEVSMALLGLMADLAERTPYGVVVLASGHPHDVFETGRISSHTRGHAVDIHLLDDEYVVDGRRTEDSPTHELTRWLYDHPDVSNLGSPWALDGFGGRSFTDAVHLDHLHVSTGR